MTVQDVTGKDRRILRRGWKSLGAVTAIAPLLALTACGDENGGGAAEAGGEEFELTYSTFQPSHHPVTTGAIEPFIEAVEERTDGRVTISLFSDGSLADTADQPQLLQSGAADIIDISPAQAPTEFIFGDVIGTYVAESDDPAAEGAQVAWSLVHQAPIIDRLDELSIVPLAAYALPPYEYFSSSPIEDIPGDLQGSPTSTAGGLSEEVMAALGMSPTSIASNELYEALQRGTVDSFVHPWYTVETYSLAEQTVHATEGIGVLPNPPLYSLMSRSTWDSLPEDIQEIIYEEGKKFSLNAGRALQEDADIAKDKYVPDSIELREITEGERSELLEVLPTVLDDFIARMDDVGRGEQAQQAVDAVEEIQGNDIDPTLPVEEWPDFDID